MVSRQLVEQQLKQLGFNHQSWGRAEIRELPSILLPDEQIYECVNGFYEGGFALLVATDVRVLLIDKKPLNYLTVEDLRFDMINEIDYSHRLMGAQIIVATGSKNLRFRSYNQPRLRKLINHVQHCMADSKKKQSEHQEGQNQHLEQINQQLQTYLIAQQQHQERLQQQLEQSRLSPSPSTAVPIVDPDPIKPSPELADYLFTQSLLAQYQAQQAQSLSSLPPTAAAQTVVPPVVPPGPPAQPAVQPVATITAPGQPADSQLADLYAEGMKEIFDKRQLPAIVGQPGIQPRAEDNQAVATAIPHNPLEINALRIAYSKLPMALRNRKFGRPSFHAHSQADVPAQPQPAVAQ